MNSSSKSSRYLVFLALVCLILSSIACGLSSFSTPVPTPTLPAEVESSLRTNLLGQWQVVSGGAWEGAILTFNEDGSFTISGDSQEDNQGSFFFTAENTIAFSFPDYQGSADLQFMSDDEMSLTVTTSSDGPFGTIYSVERVK